VKPKILGRDHKHGPPQHEIVKVTSLLTSCSKVNIKSILTSNLILV